MTPIDINSFFIIILALWLFAIEFYYEKKETPFALFQLLLSFICSICISYISFIMSFPLGYFLTFIIPIISIYLIADNYFGEKKKNKFKR